MRANQNCGCQGGMPGMMPMPGRQPMPGGRQDANMTGPARPPMAGGCQDTMSGMGRPSMFDGRSGMMPGASRPTMPCPAQQTGACPAQPPMPCPAQQTTEANCFDRDRFPVGMGYVPMQNWETPYSMEQGFRRGTIFPSLDYPFMMGRCRR